MDTEYILSCALELAEVTALEHAVLSSRLGAYDSVRAFVDTDSQMPDHYLQNTAGGFMDRASKAQQYFFALCSVPTVEFALKAFKERAEHLVQKKAQRDLGVTRPLAIQGLQLLESDLQRVEALVSRESDINEGLVQMLLTQMCGDLAHRWSRDLNLLAEAVDWYRCDEGRTFATMLLSAQRLHLENVPAVKLDLTQPMQTVMNLAREAQRIRRRKEAAGKRKRTSLAKAAIKKATKLFQSLGQERNLTMLVSGHEVTLQHPDSAFKFVLRPPEVEGWLVDRTQVGRTHTPYEIRLFTQDDVYLSRLCVYFDNTPVLDQLLALTLYVQSGDELKVLEKANWFGLENWTEEKSQHVLRAYPQLASKLPKKRAEGKLIHDGLIPDVFSAERAHWEPYKGRVEQWIATWMEPARLALERVATALPVVTAQLQAAQALEREATREACQQVVRQQQLALATA